ncbi:MAG: HAD-IA family hydrolase [Hyphomicrobiales bacterium]
MYLVLFDCDGTIVDSQHMIVEAMARAFGRHGLAAPARAAVVDVIGLSLPVAIARLLPEGSAVAADDIVESYKAGYFEMRSDPVHREMLFPGAREAIEALGRRADVLLGVATGKSQRGVRSLFAATGLGHHFTTIQTADDAPSKPHPGMVHQAVAETGVAMKNVVVVGDTSYDMEMAAAAGATGIGVAWGYHPPAVLESAGAARIIARFDELVPLLEHSFFVEGQ